MIDTEDPQQLVQQGNAAANAGDMMAARERFRRATSLDPNNVQAWLGLSAAVPVLAEKREHLLKALAIDPTNVEAQESLRYVEKLQGEGLQIAPSKRRELRHESGDASPLLASPAADATEVQFCYRHPNRETGLLCTNCGRPVCSECAKPAVVGQLCPECRKERRPTNYKVSAREVVIGFVVSLLVSAVVGFLLTFMPFGLFAFFLLIMIGPAIAEFVVRIVDRVTHTKRGRAMQATVGFGIVLGTLPFVLFGNPLFMLLYLVLAVSISSARLR